MGSHSQSLCHTHQRVIETSMYCPNTCPMQGIDIQRHIRRNVLCKFPCPKQGIDIQRHIRRHVLCKFPCPKQGIEIQRHIRRNVLCKFSCPKQCTCNCHALPFLGRALVKLRFRTVFVYPLGRVFANHLIFPLLWWKSQGRLQKCY